MVSLASLPRPASSRIAVRVTPDALRRVRGDHPWVYAESILSHSREGVAGDLAVVFDPDRNFAAIGLWDPASPIRLKVLHHGRPVTIDRAFWAGRLRTALARRAALRADGRTTGYRVVNGENDGFPGLVLDAYDRTLVLKLYSAAWVPHLADVVGAVEELLHPEAIILRHARSLTTADLHGLEEGDALVGICPDEPVLFQEHGLTFEADVVRGQKTGHFLDQRENRVWAAELAEGAQVLDVFASTGGFTVHCAAGGASEITSVDLSGPTLAVTSRNLAHNGDLPAVAACTYHPAQGDSFETMEGMARRKQRFDLVIVDPPSFAQRQINVPKALEAYARLTTLAVALVRPGGVLVQCSCSSRVTAEQFHTSVARAAAKAGRPLEEFRRTGHPVDHPVSFPEGNYLKAVFAHVP